MAEAQKCHCFGGFSFGSIAFVRGGWAWGYLEWGLRIPAAR